jgi:hypothetical protein
MKLLFITWLLLTFAGPLWIILTGQVDLQADYSTANRDSAHIAPEPGKTHEAVIQIYTARAFNWRGIIASHCWISVKPARAKNYTVYQVVGWRTYHGLPALTITEDVPDRNWYNAPPRLILDLRGNNAEALIPKIDEAAGTYPYRQPYTLWPGPNSNTFPAYVARQVPELGLALPADAIGKDFLPFGAVFARAPSGTGYQFSLFGIFGILVAKKEGVEINLLGLVYGVKFSPFQILLPGIG